MEWIETRMGQLVVLGLTEADSGNQPTAQVEWKLGPDKLSILGLIWEYPPTIEVVWDRNRAELPTLGRVLGNPRRPGRTGTGNREGLPILGLTAVGFGKSTDGWGGLEVGPGVNANAGLSYRNLLTAGVNWA